MQLIEIKKHLNIDEDFIEDDLYLTTLGNVAHETIMQYLNRENDPDYSDFYLSHPSIGHAELLLLGTLYANRESVTYGSPVMVPHTLDYLIQPYIIY